MLAFRDVIDLVIRRRVADLEDCRLWLILALFVIPLGMLMSLEVRNMADESAIYAWLYANNWSWTLTQIPGFWQELTESASRVLLSYLALGCWSWTAGFLVGSSSRRTLWATGSIFFGVLFVVGSIGVPNQLGTILVIGRARDYVGNAVVFANHFYRYAFPPALEALLVVLPAWHGMRQNVRCNRMPPPYRSAALTASLVTVCALTCQCLVWWQFRFWNNPPPWISRVPSLFLLAVLGPTTYLVLIAIRSRAIRDLVVRTRVFRTRRQSHFGGI